MALPPAPARQRINGTSGDDFFDLTNPSSGVRSSGYQDIYGYAGNDIINGGSTAFTYIEKYVPNTAGELVPVWVTAQIGGNNKIYGGEGNDVLGSAEGGGKDTLYGEAGNDTLYGGDKLGGNIMYGGLGDDTYRDVAIVNGQKIIENANEGYDTLYTVWRTANLAENVEEMHFSGNYLNNRASLNGNKIDNWIYGREGKDLISGGAGNDTLVGYQGNDFINGGLGNDIIDLGIGQDDATGGAGSDTFIFRAGESSLWGDRPGNMLAEGITDFQKGALGVGDVIDYRNSNDADVYLQVGGVAGLATAGQASINQSTGITTFALGSGKTREDALADISASFTAGGDNQGDFAFFRVNNAGAGYLFISDGVAGVTANDVLVAEPTVKGITAIDLSGGNLTILS